LPAAAGAARAELSTTITLAAPGAGDRLPLTVPLVARPAVAEADVAEPAVQTPALLAQTATVAAGEARAPQHPRPRKRARRAPARAQRPAAPPRPAKTAQASAAPAAPCDPPYLIDAHGIKRFRRDCVGSGE
jgi:serine/threonine-protein kinase